MRRRDFLALPGVVLAPRVERAGVVHRVRLEGAEPLVELGRVWRYGAARRVMVRAEGAWWAGAVVSSVAPKIEYLGFQLLGSGCCHRLQASDLQA